MDSEPFRENQPTRIEPRSLGLWRQTTGLIPRGADAQSKACRRPARTFDFAKCLAAPLRDFCVAGINRNVKDKSCSHFAPPYLRVSIVLAMGGQLMRWYVSIGAMLLAGALAGDVAAVNATPARQP